MIVFCGYANLDLTVNVPVLPDAGARVHASDIQCRGGGMAANAAVAAARMGAEARFAGVVGADPRSEEFLDALTVDGVDVNWAGRGGRLTTAVVIVTPDGERSIVSQDDDVTPEHVDGLARALSTDGGGWLYLDGYRFPWAAAPVARVAGVRVVVDLDGCESVASLRAVLSVAEHTIAGRAQLLRLLGEEADLSAVAAEYGTHLLVTDGARGWCLYSPSRRVHGGAAITVPVVDATGAGDCFVGAYVAELDRGAKPASAARVAAVAAGLSCTQHGARAGAPDRRTVEEYLAALPTTDDI